MTKVIQFPDGVAVDSFDGDIDPDQVLQHAVGRYRKVMILGIDHEGDIHLQSSHDDIADINFGIDWIKYHFMRTRYPT